MIRETIARLVVLQSILEYVRDHKVGVGAALVIGAAVALLFL